MKFLDRIKLNWLTRKNSSKWTDSDKRKITELIDKRNKEIEVVRWEVFPGEGQSYRYYHDNGNVRAEGFYYALGYDKKDQLQDEKFQGKNVEYHENGQAKDVFFYKDGIATGEYYSYDPEGNLIFSQPAEIWNTAANKRIRAIGVRRKASFNVQFAIQLFVPAWHLLLSNRINFLL